MKWALKMPSVLRFVRSEKWLVKAMLLVGVIGVALAIFLSVRSSPTLTTVWWLPHFVSHWADRHGVFRNFPAYAILAVPFLMITPGILQRACVIASLAVVAALLEVIQLWIPTRFADLGDIFWSWAGLDRKSVV